MQKDRQMQRVKRYDDNDITHNWRQSTGGGATNFKITESHKAPDEEVQEVMKDLLMINP